MRRFLYNFTYFLKEAQTTIRLNPLSNILSIVSTGLIFFILAMVISGWWISSHVVEAIQGEAEISAYYQEGLNQEEIQWLLKAIGQQRGVREARLINEKEAYARMENILGREAQVLSYLDDNPFSAFIEVKIDLEKIEEVTRALRLEPGIDHVRDNREVLDRLHSIAKMLKVLGILVVTAVGISTLVIIGHIIRLGIYNNREQINTLRLLGAPEAFIAFPFLLVGMFVTLLGSSLAAVVASIALKLMYTQLSGPLPFIPMPPREAIATSMTLTVIALGIGLGFAGGLLGLSTAKEK